MSNIKVLLDPEKREQYLNYQLNLIGVDVKEDKISAYCPISLTHTPKELKPIIQTRQRILMDEILKPAGITAYDPASAPFSPDTNLTDDHTRVYGVDFARVAGAKFLTGHNILPSTGMGIEFQIAQQLIKVPVIFHDKKIRVGRMLPPRAIYLQYDDFAVEAPKFIGLFETLQKYDIGIGFNDMKPALLGFVCDSDKIVDLEELAFEMLPDNRWIFDGKKPVPEFLVTNSEIFRELSK